MSADVHAIAAEISKVDEAILKAMPFVSTIIGFVPGAQVAAPFMPLIVEVLQAVDKATEAVAGGNTSAAIDAVINEIKSHLTPGSPNSPALSG